MRVFVTKYVLSNGAIQEMEGTQYEDESLTVKREGSFTSFFHKGEWFEDRAKAVANANSRRDKKIKSLRKQIDKLSKMTFD